MFLNALLNRNPKLLELAFTLHQQGLIQPDSYLLDLDKIEENARLLLQEAESHGLQLYFMTKQLGRNPAVCHMLTDMGYAGAVVVDYREAEVMMQHNIPIAHAGHLVQIPDAMLSRVLEYGVGLMTVYSLDKAKRISSICAGLGRTQDIALKFVGDNDLVYPSQESGFPLTQLDSVVEQISQLPNLRITDITAFPCYLYDGSMGEVKPTPNLTTLGIAAARAEKLLGYPLRLNLPSCTQTSIIGTIVAAGGFSGEPGSALIGMTPNNCAGTAVETPAIAYVSEISHDYGQHSHCFGGGYYRRGEVSSALVGRSLASARRIGIVKPSSDNIDYHIELSGLAEVGEAAVMCFRTQLFVTRSQVVVVSGLHNGNPVIEGVYNTQGLRLSGGSAL